MLAMRHKKAVTAEVKKRYIVLIRGYSAF